MGLVISRVCVCFMSAYVFAFNCHPATHFTRFACMTFLQISVELWKGERAHTKISGALDYSQAQLKVHQKGGKRMRLGLACWRASAEALLPHASCLQVSDCRVHLSSSSGMAAGGRAKEAIHRSHRCATGGAAIKTQRHGRN